MTNDNAVPTVTPAQFDSVAETLSHVPTAIVTPTGQITFGRTAQILEALAEKVTL